MSSTALLIVLAAVFGILGTVLHVIMIVQGFKASVGWGLVALLVPFGSIVFGFAKSGRKVLASLLLVSFVGCAACGGIASYLTAKALAASLETATKGMQEFDKQTQSLDDLENLQL